MLVVLKRQKTVLKIHVTLDGEEHAFDMSRWTGTNWEDASFHRVDEDEAQQLVDLKSFEVAWCKLLEANDSNEAQALASLTAWAFEYDYAQQVSDFVETRFHPTLVGNDFPGSPRQNAIAIDGQNSKDVT